MLYLQYIEQTAHLPHRERFWYIVFAAKATPLATTGLSALRSAKSALSPKKVTGRIRLSIRNCSLVVLSSLLQVSNTYGSSIDDVPCTAASSFANSHDLALWRRRQRSSFANRLSWIHVCASTKAWLAFAPWIRMSIKSSPITRRR